MNVVRSIAAGVALLSLSGMAPPVVVAQEATDWDSGRVQATREELRETLARYEETSRSTAHSADFRARAGYEVALIETRLRDGDFQVGDQVRLEVEGEEALTGDFVVGSQRVLPLPLVGDIVLRGVLRSELEEHLATELRRFLVDPRVRARSSIRILVSGQVRQPGYYVLGTDALLSDALMAAGGPAPEARLTELRVERANTTIWDGLALQQGIAEGRTVDQLGLRAGDHLYVPGTDESPMSTLGRWVVAGIPALALAITTIAQLF